MKSIRITFRQWQLLCVICLALACEKADVEPPTDNAGNNGNNGGNNGPLTPNEFSEMLLLENAVRKQGAVPTGVNGNLLLNVKDSIFILTGTLGSVVQIKHDPGQKPNGVYIYIAGSDHYYDTPFSDSFGGAGSDSLSAFQINIDPESAGGGQSQSVIIKPYDNSGNVVDEFERIISVEKPAQCDDIESFLKGLPILTEKWWHWQYTYLQSVRSGEVVSLSSPVHYAVSNYETGGCCLDGYSWYDPAECTEHKPTYRSLTVDRQFMRQWDEALQFAESNNFFRTLGTQTSNYNPDKSNFCSGEAGYDIDDDWCGYQGNYSFPSCNEIEFKTTVYLQDEDGYPVCGWLRNGKYTIEVSDHGNVMVLRRSDGEGEWGNWIISVFYLNDTYPFDGDWDWQNVVPMSDFWYQ